MASMAVVLAVGARPRGQASRGTPVSMTTKLARPRVELGRPVKLIRGEPRRLRLGRRMVSSWVSPLLDRTRITSSLDTMPRSPCMASTGCRKRALVPVELKVATSFRATIPDFPTPARITRPLARKIRSTALTKLWSSFCTR